VPATTTQPALPTNPHPTSPATWQTAVSHHAQAKAAAGAEGIYGRLVRHSARLGLPAVAGRTPLELAQRLTARLDVLAGCEWWGQRWVAGRVTAVKPALARFIQLYNQHQYRHTPQDEGLGMLWRQMERPLIYLVIWQKFTFISHNLTKSPEATYTKNE
jgi:hypothetical protein